MKILIMVSLLFFNAQTVFANSLKLDELLHRVKQSQGAEAQQNKARESQFLSEKNQQQKKLSSVLSSLNQEQKLSHQLKTQLEDNEAILSQLETDLKSRSGDLGELFGVARQAAGDLQADLKESLVSAQFPNRVASLDAIANSKALPTIEKLRTLWFTLQHEMTESGKVVHFKTQIQVSGALQEAKVIRIGTFNALANGEYLEFLTDTTRLNRLERQPNGYLDDAQTLFSANTDSPIAVGIDPTRGVILSMLIQAPDSIERVKQGGFIGYVILVMGAIGFLYAIFRLISLSITGSKMKAQMNQSANDKNPLGRVFIAAEQGKNADTDNLELILDEAIIREIPLLERGLPMIKLLAAVAPLLGLLGTVTGMIATFQSISLFGTGDPKLMASGISQALVTTMLGLCIAIPLLFLHSIVASRSRILVQILDEQTAGLISRRSEKK